VKRNSDTETYKSGGIAADCHWPPKCLGRHRATYAHNDLAQNEAAGCTTAQRASVPILSNGLSSSSRRRRDSGNTHTLPAVRRNGRAHRLGNHAFFTNPTQARSRSFHGTDSAAHKFDDHASHVANPVMGRLLSPALFFLVGIRILLLDRQLHHSRLRRSCSPADMAGSGSGRERNGRSDVWTHRELLVCDRDAPRGSRDAALGGTTPRHGKDVHA